MDATHAPSWRHVVFHGAVLAMVCAGFMRARAPLEDTDRPFIISALACMTIAIMPPPAVALAGPLCQAVDVWEAADRMVRAFCFGSLYSITVYASTRTRNTSYSNTSIVFFRSASASIWVSGAMLWWLPLTAAQCAIVMHARAIRQHMPLKEYKKLESAASTDDEDPELGTIDLEPKLADPVAEQDRLLREKPIYADDGPAVVGTKLIDLGVTVQEASLSPVPAHEPVGPLTFQQLCLNEPVSDSGQSSAFEASVAKAMAMEQGNSPLPQP